MKVITFASVEKLTVQNNWSSNYKYTIVKIMLTKTIRYINVIL